ncbi:MAG: pyridoxamine 5'-phosphate oxidase family protein [Spirochaetes bacterium]|nr:pyridoxamine 5'-phosphate oxidase family protein [Spirochaetota bacterium]
MKDFIKFANENHVSFLATSENDQPHVRALGFWFADETGFYFQTGAMKELYMQLKKNPKTEVCFYKPGDGAGKMLRITGVIEFLDDARLKEKCLADRPFLKSLGMKADSSALILFRITHGKGHFWTMENNLKPKEFIEF